MKRISDLAQVRQTEHCPIRIRDCSILADPATKSRCLQLELENHARRVLAQIHIRVSCYNRRDEPVGVLDQVIDTRQSTRGGVSHHNAPGLVLPDGDFERVSVKIKKVLAYRCGDHGEIIDITFGEP